MTFKTPFPELHKELFDYTNHNLQIFVQWKKKNKQKLTSWLTFRILSSLKINKKNKGNMLVLSSQ